MSMDQGPVLLDVTRMIARRWARRLPTGIDRVCEAYLAQFGQDARATIQHRGVIRVLDPAASRALIALLTENGPHFRKRLAVLAPRALSNCTEPTRGSTYVNVAHTDFDLEAHARWVRKHALRAVYMIHDLIPIMHPHHCRPRAVARHRGRVHGALQHGAGIVVGSRAVLHDLERFAARTGQTLPPTLVAPLAGGHRAVPAVRPNARGGYFLCVGTIESRKNHAMLLDVWQRLRGKAGQATPQLILVGQWGAGSQAVRDALEADPLLQDCVTHLTHCPDAELGELMAGARAVILPSFAEGFGLPVAEALALGTPVIASDLPCFREIGQGVPTLLDPADPAAWERTIATFRRGDPEHLRQTAMLPRFRPTTWGEHFETLQRWLPRLQSSPRHANGLANASDRQSAAHPRAPAAALTIAHTHASPETASIPLMFQHHIDPAAEAAALPADPALAS